MMLLMELMDPRYAGDLRAVLADEGTDQLQRFLEIDTADEIPFYSDLTQIAFLKDLTVAEQNTVLIRAAAAHLADIVRFAGSADVMAQAGVIWMISVTGWWDPEFGPNSFSAGETWLLQPNFWVGNPLLDEMAVLTLETPSTPCGAFVTQALAGAPGFRVFESPVLPGEPAPRRVYIDWTA